MRLVRAHRSRTILLGLAVAISAATVLAYSSSFLETVEDDTVDVRFAVRGAEEPPDDVVVVAIGAGTFQRLDERWPFPRSEHARVIDRLRRDGARVIAYDVQFTEPTSPREDNALIRAVDRAGNVVLATEEVDRRGRTNVFGGDDVVADVGARVGHAAFPNDAGGVIRKMAYELDGLTSFAVAAEEVATGKSVDRALFERGPRYIDYHGPPGSIDTLPFWRVRRGRFEPGTFRDRIVVVGAESPTLGDTHATSAGGARLMPGPEVHANAISTLRRGFPLRDSSSALDVVLIVLMGLSIPLASLRLRPLTTLLAGAAVAAGYVVATQVAFNSGLVLPVLYPLAALVLSTVQTLGAGYVLESLERQRVRTMFGRFVPDRVVDDVLSRREEVMLAGAELDCTALFSDIRGFTTFSERHPPERVLEVVNRYFGEMCEAVTDNGGTLTQFQGDGLMALYGAPTAQPDHADRALRTALEMLEEKLPRFNEWLREEGLGTGFRIGIGLHSGPVMAGNVGSVERMQYTAMGDTVNTASRLEALTKELGTPLVVSSATERLLRSRSPALEELGEVAIRGRASPLRVWGLRPVTGAADADPSDALLDRAR